MDKKIKIMLDAGHYGKYNRSPVVREYYESVQMWALCELLAEELKNCGFEVGKTRDKIETDLEVTKRGKKAKGYDLFISLHSNAVAPGGSEKTDRVCVYAAFDGINGSHRLASALAVGISDLMGTSGGYVKTRKSDNGDREYYGVLRGARSVGCPLYYLIEHSFHTNARAAKWLLDKSNLVSLARMEAKVIAGYFGAENREVKGDVDGSGELDQADIVLIKRHIVGSRELSEEQKAAADINRDGKIDIADYTAVKRMIHKKQ